MDVVSAIALSGMNLASLQMQSSASNLANMNDTAPRPGSGVAGPKPFAPTAVFGMAPATGGVEAEIQPVQPAAQAAYDPSSPYADGQGLVSTPNVDPSAEVVAQAQALASFRASVASLKAYDDTQQSLLDIVA